MYASLRTLVPIFLGPWTQFFRGGGGGGGRVPYLFRIMGHNNSLLVQKWSSPVLLLMIYLKLLD